MTRAEGVSSSWRGARLGVCGVFFVGGCVLASWVPYIPIVQRRLHLGEADLGGVLFAMTAGALCAVLGSGLLIARFGSRAVTAVAGALFCLLLPTPVFAPNIAVLVAAMYTFGAAFGAMDVSMNSQAAIVQKAADKPLMSGFHGLYSLGGLAGAAVAGTMLSLQLAPEAHVGLVVGAMLLLCIVSALALPEKSPADKEEATGMHVSLPLSPLLGMSLLAFGVFVGEGAVVDWAAVYLVNDLGVEPGVGVSGFGAFSLAMAAGRLAGDRVAARLGFGRFAVVSALLAGGGLSLSLASLTLSVSVAGFALAGLGFANLVPILFSQAARATPESPEKGIAGVAGIGYLGLVAGPPAIGFVAQEFGLRFALAAVAASMAVVATLLPLALSKASRAGLVETGAAPDSPQEPDIATSPLQE